MDEGHARPGCGRSTLDGAGGRSLGSQLALAVAGLRSPGREGGGDAPAIAGAHQPGQEGVRITNTHASAMARHR